MQISVHNEYDSLRDVILARVDNYQLTEPINLTQEHFYSTNPPLLRILQEEQRHFEEVLLSVGATIHWADLVDDCPYQVNTRDIGVAIEDTLVLCKLKRGIRQKELDGITRILADVNGKIVKLEDSDATLEGGDIVLDGNGIIYVGISERTNRFGYEFVRDIFGHRWSVVPLKLKSGILHLDTVFNVLPGGLMLICPDAIEDIQTLLEAKRRLVRVNKVEQFDLATNVLAVNPHTVIADVRNKKTNAELRNYSFDVLEIDFSHTSRIGGSFRCATLPICRS